MGGGGGGKIPMSLKIRVCSRKIGSSIYITQ